MNCSERLLADVLLLIVFVAISVWLTVEIVLRYRRSVYLLGVEIDLDWSRLANNIRDLSQLVAEEIPISGAACIYLTNTTTAASDKLFRQRVMENPYELARIIQEVPMQFLREGDYTPITQQQQSSITKWRGDCTQVPNSVNFTVNPLFEVAHQYLTRPPVLPPRAGCVEVTRPLLDFPLAPPSPMASAPMGDDGYVIPG